MIKTGVQKRQLGEGAKAHGDLAGLIFNVHSWSLVRLYGGEPCLRNLQQRELYVTDGGDVRAIYYRSRERAGPCASVEKEKKKKTGIKNLAESGVRDIPASRSVCDISSYSSSWMDGPGTS